MRSRTLLAVAERILFVAGGVLIGYVLYHRIEAELFERKQTQRLEEVRAYLEDLSGGKAEGPAVPDTNRGTVAEGLNDGIGILGRIESHRIGLSAVIIDSVEPRHLDLAVGHFPETPMFGQGGNVALAAHRDFHFSPLRRLTLGDTMVVSTLTSDYFYVVDSLSVVPPSAVHVLDPTEKSRLTLVTCYPFDYVGPAPNRFIVRASEIPKPAAGEGLDRPAGAETRSAAIDDRGGNEQAIPGNPELGAAGLSGLRRPGPAASRPSTGALLP